MKFALHLGHGFFAESGGNPRKTACVEIPAHGVGALFIQNAPRIDYVALVLTHFYSVRIVYVSQYDTRFEGRAVKQNGRNHEQRVEPAARLIDCFGDEIGGEGFFKYLFILERIMILRERHRTRIEPAIDYFGRAFHLPAALVALTGQMIQIRTVQFDICRRAAFFLKFPSGSDHLDPAAVFAYPYGQRRPPVAVARKPPVDHVFKEVTHTSVFDRFGDPVHRTVGGNEAVFYFCHFDKPTGARIVKQRRIAPPTMRITVFKRNFFKEQSFFGKHLQHDFIGFFCKHAVQFGASLIETAPLIHQLHYG